MLRRILEKHKNISFPISVFVGWLLTLVLIVHFGFALHDKVIPFGQIARKWDGGWYGSIVSGGYQFHPGAQSNVVFFPGYPLLVRLASVLFRNIWVSGMLVSLICFLAALAIIYRLAFRTYGEQTAHTTLVLLCAWPFSFFFGLLYTESLFLLLAALTLLAIDTRRWWWAALFAGLASGVRVVGIGLLAAVLFEFGWPHIRKLNGSVIARLVGMGFIGVGGIVAFSVFLYHRTGDAFAFVHSQHFWPGRTGGILGLRHTLGPIVHGSLYSNPACTRIFELFSLLLFVGLIAYCIQVKRIGWALFSACALFLPVASGGTTSINRYVLIMIPCFIMLARLFRSPYRLMAWVLPAAALGAVILLTYTQTNVFLG